MANPESRVRGIFAGASAPSKSGQSLAAGRMQTIVFRKDEAATFFCHGGQTPEGFVWT